MINPCRNTFNTGFKQIKKILLTLNVYLVLESTFKSFWLINIKYIEAVK